MKSTIRYILGFLFFIFIVEMVVVSPTEINDRKNNQKQPISLSEGQGNGFEQSMDAIHVIESKNESKEWEIWADSAAGVKNQLNLKKVKASFFSVDGVAFHVVGEQGFVETAEKNLVIQGHVITKSSNGYIFKTAEIKYNSAARVLECPSSVDASGPRDKSGQSLRITGSELLADLNLGVITIKKNVQAKKAMRDSKSLVVAAEKVEFSGRERGVRFLGHVTIDMDGMRITGPDALFQYDSQSSLLKSIDLVGGVRVSDISKWASSEKLRIDLVKNEYVFDGSPRVVQNNDELRGDRIVFLNGGKNVKVQNAKIKVSPEALGQDQKDKK